MSIVMSQGDQSSNKREDSLFKSWQSPKILQQALDNLLRGKGTSYPFLIWVGCVLGFRRNSASSPSHRGRFVNWLIFLFTLPQGFRIMGGLTAFKELVKSSRDENRQKKTSGLAFWDSGKVSAGEQARRLRFIIESYLQHLLATKVQPHTREEKYAQLSVSRSFTES